MTANINHPTDRSSRPSERETVIGELDNYIGFHLRLAQNASFNAFKRQVGQGDLRPGRYAVLAIIHDNPGITPLALSRASGRDKSTITPVLRDLERANAIIRRPNATDKRSAVLVITPEGEEMFERLAACAAAHDRRLDAIVGDKKHELIALLRRIAASLD